MKNYLFYLMLFLLMPVLSCDARPVAVFEETVYNFGKISTESSVKHTFKFRNAGNGTLVIERIKAG
jgi:hypothetical protein